ncbi:XrtA system polysaccharide deacetylase [Rheinheimera riviphila]|uniref:XrtA system polysaccharide deacetylase n=1 Tax=Rheinheimera riviphila TaxID=1834037 RepID=UPI001980581E|nr:XrtA system polysaccharide deacetylase [Rheinheimera riviphila]
MTLSINKLNALTVDVEDYFHVAAFEQQITPADWQHMTPRVDRNTRVLLDQFDRNNAKATFFFLGWVAERFPDLVKEVQRRGHEVASHGFSHTRVHQQTQAEFRDDVVKAKDILEQLTGEAVIGYRAPSFSINKQSEWAFEILKDIGHVYSSSTYPIKHDLYGVPDWPQQPYMRPEGIWEIPMPTLTMLGRQLPIAGGGYFRLMPYWLSSTLISKFLREDRMPYMFYFHPWEVDPEQPRVEGAGQKSKFRHYVNLDKMEHKLDRLLTQFNWGSLGQVYQQTLKNL